MMKNYVLVWLLWLLTAPLALAQITLNCPDSFTTSFQSGDIISGGGVSATKCQGIILKNYTGICSGCTAFTFSFSNGSPAPAFLPPASTTQTSNYAFARGQTIVTYTGTDGTDVRSCSFRVTLVDDVSPVILSPPTPVAVNAKTIPVIPDLRTLVQVDDNCDYTLTQTPTPGSPVSGTSVSLTFVATDGSGNESLPFEMALEQVAATEYDGMALAATGGCAGDGIAVTLSGLQANSPYTVLYRVDNGITEEAMPVNSGGTLDFNASGALPEGEHTVTILSIANGIDAPVFINRTASVYVGKPSATISGLLVNNTLSNGTCVVKITGTANGYSFVFTGPNGYVFSNLFRSSGVYNVVAEGIKVPGLYTLKASYPSNSCGTPSLTRTIEVGGVPCTDK